MMPIIRVNVPKWPLLSWKLNAYLFNNARKNSEKEISYTEIRTCRFRQRTGHISCSAAVGSGRILVATSTADVAATI